MNRRTLVRGVQAVVGLTLVTFVVFVALSLRAQEASLSQVLGDLQPAWLLLAAAVGLCEGVFGGLRMWSLGRVLWPALRVRTGIASEFALLFCGGVTPGQSGSAPGQMAVLVNAGMRLVDAATASLVVALCTITFYLTSALLIVVLRAQGLLVVGEGLAIDVLVGLSVTVFGAALAGLLLCAAWPLLLETVLGGLGRVLSPLWRGALRVACRVRWLRPHAERGLAAPGVITARLCGFVHEIHDGLGTYLRGGKRAIAAALLCTIGLFVSRFSVAFLVILGLGLSPEPSTFVADASPYLQVLLVQALLNFALYFSPTPGASGVAEAGSSTLMAPWVSGAFEIPFLLLWRTMALFLGMVVGGLYVFRTLGTGVLEARTREAAEARQARAGSATRG